MAITDNIITTAEVNALKVAAETRQRIQGEPDAVKTLLDRLPLKIVEKYNALIATLQKQTTGSGAEQIGCAAIPGVNDDESGTVREMLISLKGLIDDAVISGLVTNSVDETYLTADAVMLSLLTDYAIASAGTPAALATTDTVAEALGKIERILSNILAGVQAAGKATDYSTSGGIATALAGKQATLTWDTTPTAASNNPVRSYGLHAVVANLNSLINGKQNTLTFDYSPTEGSSNPVFSEGIKIALDAKANDNAVVKLAGAQTIADVKTFSSSPIVPTADANNKAVNKGQMDTAISAGNPFKRTFSSGTSGTLDITALGTGTYEMYTFYGRGMSCLITVWSIDSPGIFSQRFWGGGTYDYYFRFTNGIISLYTIELSTGTEAENTTATIYYRKLS